MNLSPRTLMSPLPATLCAAAVAAVLLSLLVAPARSDERRPAPAGTTVAGTAVGGGDAVERGRYLVTVLGYHDCHTPLVPGPDGPVRDMERMLSGHPEQLLMPAAPPLPEGPWQVVASGTGTAWSGPWGISFTANLTPDPDTGLGKWSWENFRDTIRTGRHMGRGRPVLPPMPIPMYRHLTDADLQAVFAYLQSIPPVRNRVPEPVAPAGD
jgi:hypothetical protein